MEQVEKIVAAEANNVFVFGNDWGVKHLNSLEPDFVTSALNRGRELVLDTSAVASYVDRDVTTVSLDQGIAPGASATAPKFSALRRSYPINALPNLGTDTFFLAGDQTARFGVGDNVYVTESGVLASVTGFTNDGTYTIQQITVQTDTNPLDNSTITRTAIVVDEPIQFDIARGNLNVRIDVQAYTSAATVVLAGDHRDEFLNATSFSIVESEKANNKSYSLLSVDLNLSGNTVLTIKGGESIALPVTTTFGRVQVGSTITAVDRGNDTFVLQTPSDETAFFAAGTTIQVSESGRSLTTTGLLTNDGDYTVVSSSYTNGQTRILVAEPIARAVTGGKLARNFEVVQIDRGHDVFTISNNQPLPFTAGSKVVVGRSGEDLIYTLEAVNLDGGDKHLTVVEPIENFTVTGQIAPADSILKVSTGKSFPRKDSGIRTFEIAGDQTTRYAANVLFYVVGSYQQENDGAYEVLLSDYDAERNVTTIQLNVNTTVQDAKTTIANDKAEGVIYVATEKRSITNVDNTHDQFRVKGDETALFNLLDASNTDYSLTFEFLDSAGNVVPSNSINPSLTSSDLTAAVAPVYTPSFNLELDFRAVNKELSFTFGRTTDPVTGQIHNNLTIARASNLAVPGFVGVFEKLGKVWNGVFNNFNKIVVTDVDVNTTIFAGRDTNLFSSKEGVVFPGRIVGGTGFRHPGAIFTPGNLANAVKSLGTGLPPLTVVNTLDFSDTGLLSATAVTLGTDLGAPSAQSASLHASAPRVRVKGFSGMLENFSNVTYGPGFDFITGTGAFGGIASDAASALITAIKDKNTSGLTDLFTNRIDDLKSLSFGSNKINVAGNVLSRLLPDSSAGRGIKAAVGVLKGTIAPGVHLVSGLTGADTYSFDGFWGTTIVAEPPDITFGGVTPPEFFDTLDFSDIRSNLTFTIEKVEVEGAVGLASNLVTVSLPPFDLPLPTALQEATPYLVGTVFANDIENIIGGRGVNTFIFKDEASLRGTINVGDGGSVVLDYADYFATPGSSGLDVDSIAGTDQVLIPAFDMGFLGTFPGIVLQFGRADGVGGNRFGGLTFDAQVFADNAVYGMTNLTGSRRDDHLSGTNEVPFGKSGDETFNLSFGGRDVVDGRGGVNTVTFRDAPLEVTGFTANTIEVAHDQLAWFAAGSSFRVVGSSTAGNNREYTVGSVVFDSSNDVTVVTLAVGESISDPGASTAGKLAFDVTVDLRSNPGSSFFAPAVPGTASFTGDRQYALAIDANQGFYTITASNGTGTETTRALAHDADDATIQAALAGLTNLNPADVSVTPASAGGALVTFLNGTDATLTVNVDAIPLYDSQPVQVTTTGLSQGTAGTATLVNNDTLTIDADAGVFQFSDGSETTRPIVYSTDFDAVALDIIDALDDLTSIGDGNVTVTFNQSSSAWEIVFDPALSTVPTLTTVTAGIELYDATSAAVTLGLVKGTTGAATVRNSDTLTLDADGGVFAISADWGVATETTVPVLFDADEFAIRDALAALPSVGAGNVTVTPGTNSNSWDIRFAPGIAPILSTIASDLPLSSTTTTFTSHAGLVKFASVPSTASSLTSIQNIEGGPGNDLLIGDSGSNEFQFSGDFGHDIIFGMGGAGDRIRFESNPSGAVRIPEGYVFYFEDGNQNVVKSVTAYGFGSDSKVITPSPGWRNALSTLLPLNFTVLLLADETAVTPDGAAVTDADLTDLLAEATQRWIDLDPVGFDASRLNDVVLQISDLPGQIIGQTEGRVIQIDANAAGLGWFVDPTPGDDAEFGTAARGALFADADTTAGGGIDLLTTLMHELGHVYGYGHVATDDGAYLLMGDALGTGMRLSPTHLDTTGDPTQGAATLHTTGSAGLLGEAKVIFDGLDAFAQWATAFASESSGLFPALDLPLVDLASANLADDLSALFTVTGSEIQTAIEASILHEIGEYFASAGSAATAGGILAINGIEPSTSGNLKEFHASVNLHSLTTNQATLDLSGVGLPSTSTFLADSVVPTEVITFMDTLLSAFQLAQTAGTGPAIPVTANLDLEFDFGVDETGAFYVVNPGLRAAVRLGDEPLAVVAVDVDAGTVSIAGDQQSLFADGDTINVSESTGNDGNYTIAAGGISFDGTNTVIVVEEPLVDNFADGKIRPTFALSSGLQLGPLGLQVEGGVASFELDVDLNTEGVLQLDDLSGGGALTLSDINLSEPLLNDTSGSEVFLPISLSGSLPGLTDAVIVFSSGNSILASVNEFLPATGSNTIEAFYERLVNVIPTDADFSSFAEFNGISLDLILAAINSGLDALVGQSPVNEVQQISYSGTTPFTLGFTDFVTTSIVIDTDPNVTASNIEAALEALSSVEDVAVVWNTTDATWDVTFVSTTTSSKNVDLLTSSDTNVAFSTQTGGQDGTGKLYAALPLINKSAAQIFGNGGVDFVTDLRNGFRAATDAVTDLGGLEAAINAELTTIFTQYGLVSDKPVTLEYRDSAFYFNLDLDLEYETQIPLAVNLADLDPTLADLSSALGLTFETGGELDVVALAELDFGIGFDLSNILAPDLFFEDTSGLQVSLNVANSAPLSLKALIDVPVLGEVGIQVVDGSAELNLSLGFGLADDSDDDGRYSLSELPGAVEIFFRGDAQADLPLYFPTASFPMGGTTDDLDNNGIGDNVLHIAGELDATVGSPISTNLEYSIPSLVPSFDIFAILNDPNNLLVGLEGMFQQIKSGLESQFSSLNLPLIGDKLQGAAAFVDTLRDSVLDITNASESVGSLARYNSSGGLGRTLAEAAALNSDGVSTNDVTVSDLLFDEIRNAFYENLGAAQGGLNILRVPELDAEGQPVFNSSTGAVSLVPVTSPDQIQIEVTGDGVQFNFTMGDSLLKWMFPSEYNSTTNAISIPIDFSAAVPGFSLSTGPNDTIDLRFDYVLGFGFGFSRDDGFYLDTSGVTESGNELQLDLSAAVSSGASLSAQVIFLKGQIVDVVDGRPSGLYGSFGVDLQDSGGDGKLTFFNPFASGPSESLLVVASLSAVADVDLDATLSIPSIDLGGINFDFPSITTVIHYDQEFANATFGSGGTTTSFGGKPLLVFENVELNLGEFITGFVAPIIDKVHDVTEPLEPLVEILTTEIGLLKELGAEAYTLLDIAGTLLGQTKYAGVVKAVNAVVDIVNLIDDLDDYISNNPGPLVIGFGDFVVGGDVRDANNAAAVPSDTPNTANTDGQIDRAAGMDANKANKAKNVTKQFGTKPGSLQFPLLSSPSNLFGLLMGKEVDLFLYDLPALDLAFVYEQVFPIFPGLNAKLGGEVTATTNFTFGLSTRGFNEWQDRGFQISDAPLVFTQGFFLDDHGIQGSGNDEPEATLTATITAGASVGIGGLVEAGVEGYVKAEVNFDLNDKPEPGTGIPINNDPSQGFTPPEYDGKIYGEELLANLPLCVFDIYGDLSVGLDAFFWVGLSVFGGKITIFEARKNFFSAVIADFAYHCPDVVPVLATMQSVGSNGRQELRLDLQPQTRDGQTTGDRYMVRQIEQQVIIGGVTTTQQAIEVSARGYTNIFVFDSAATVPVITSTGTRFDDEIVVDGSVEANLELHGGGGNDNLMVYATSATQGFTRALYGDDGDDTLVGSEFDDSLYGGRGRDQLFGLEGADRLEGGDDDDVLYGGDDNDFLDGGNHADVMYGEDGDDWLQGGPGDDRMFGEVGDDWLLGNAGDDELTGGVGSDYVLGGANDDTINWTFGQPVDFFVTGGGDLQSVTASDGGQDTFVITAPSTDDAITITAVSRAGSLQATNPTGSNTTLYQLPDGIQIDVNSSALYVTDIEGLNVNAGAGADVITVNDLKGSLVSDITLDVGVASGTTSIQRDLLKPILVEPSLASGSLSYILRGSVRSADIWTIFLGGESYDYTVLSTDSTLNDVAVGLANAIAARSGGPLYSATASGGTLVVSKLAATATISSAPNQVVSVSNAQGFYVLVDPVTGSRAELAWDADDATIQTLLAGFTDPSTGGASDTIGTARVAVSGGTITFSNLTVVPVLAVGAVPNFVERETQGAFISILGADGAAQSEPVLVPAVDTTTGSPRIIAGTISGTEELTQRVEQTTLVTLEGQVNANNRWQLSIDGIPFHVDAGTGEQLSNLATRLSAEINGNGTGPYLATPDGEKILLQLRSGNEGRKFYLSDIDVLASSATDAPRVDDARIRTSPKSVFEQYFSTASVTLNGTVPADTPSVWRITLGETDFEVSVAENPSPAAIATQLRTAINTSTDYVAGGTNETITIDRATTDGITFPVEATYSYLLPGVTTVDIPFTGHDAAKDQIIVHGGQATVHGDKRLDQDTFNVITQSGEVVVTEIGGPNITIAKSHRDLMDTTPTKDTDGNPVFIHDLLTILGHEGSDNINASGVQENLISLYLQGEAGNDRLVGSVFSDVLDGGLDDDTLRGSFGVDLFYDAGGDDTLDENFDLDMSLFGNKFVAGRVIGTKEAILDEQNQNLAAQTREASITIRDGRANAATPTISLTVTGPGQQVNTYTPPSDPQAPRPTNTTSLKNYFSSTGPYQETDIRLIGDVAGTVWTLNIVSKDAGGADLTRSFTYTVGSGNDDETMVVVAKRLAEAINQDTQLQLTAEDSGPEPIILGLNHQGDHYADGAEVESLLNPFAPHNTLFENAVLVGGASNNMLIVNDSDGQIQVDNYSPNPLPVTDWLGSVILDNAGSSADLSTQTSFNEYYVIALKGTGARYSINDSGGTTSFDELYVLGTDDQVDTFTLDGADDVGIVYSGSLIDPTFPYELTLVHSTLYPTRPTQTQQDGSDVSLKVRTTVTINASDPPTGQPSLLSDLQVFKDGVRQQVVPGTSSEVTGKPNTASFTIVADHAADGSIDAGREWSIRLGGVIYSYTSIEGDTDASVATQLQALIRGSNPPGEKIVFQNLKRVTLRTFGEDDVITLRNTVVTTVVEAVQAPIS